MKSITSKSKRSGAAATPKPTTSAPASASGLKLARLLVPIDFSEPSKQALDFAATFARQHDGRITLLSVLEPIPFSGLEENPLVTSRKDVEKKLASELAALACQRLAPDQIEAVEIRSGKPFEEIVKAAGDGRADLIIIATHGYTGMKHMLLGSTTERVIRYAPCPVLTVRAQEPPGQ